MSVPKLRFKEFDGDWAKTTLGLLSDKIGDGIHATPDYDDQGEIPFINGNNLINGVVTISKTTKRINVSEFQNYKQNLSNQTIFLSINGTIGNLAFYQNEKFLLGKSVCFINLKQTVDKFFTYQILQSPQLKKTFNAELTGTTIKNLSLATVRNSEFFCPSQEEQTKIASFLSAMDEKISQLTQKNELLSQYKQGMMQKLFSQQIRFKADDGSEFGVWRSVKIKDFLLSYRLGGNYLNAETITPYPLVKMGNLGRGSINLDKIEYIPEDQIIDPEDLIKKNDLFFNTRNTLDLVGKVALWRDELPIAYYNSNLLRLDFENNIFMNYLFNEQKTLEKLKSIASGTTSVAAIYTKDLLKIDLNVPCLEEQTKIANFLSAIDQKIEVVAQQIEQAKQWKKGLLQQMFV